MFDPDKGAQGILISAKAQFSLYARAPIRRADDKNQVVWTKLS
jgi:hypothetical protein